MLNPMAKFMGQVEALPVARHIALDHQSPPTYARTLDVRLDHTNLVHQLKLPAFRRTVETDFPQHLLRNG